MTGFKHKNGFTLVEALVAISVFLIVGGGIFSIFIASIANQRYALGQQDVVNEVSFAAEYMSRALRQVQKDLTAAGLCIARGTNYESLNGGQTIRFLDANNTCREFLLGGAGELQERKSSNHTAANLGSPADLLSGDLELLQLQFTLLGETQVDTIQPRLTFFMEVRGNTGDPSKDPIIRLQTSVSQRRYDQTE